MRRNGPAEGRRYAGCRGPEADTFGDAVETVVSRCLAAAGGPPVPLVVRRGAGPVEVLVACDRRFEAAASGDPHIMIEWINEDGRPMCRVSRAMPHGS